MFAEQFHVPYIINLVYMFNSISTYLTYMFFKTILRLFILENTYLFYVYTEM